MDISTKQLLSSALQDLARGLKKLRCVVEQKHESWGTCPACNYFTDHKSSWNKHIKTEKHELRCKVAAAESGDVSVPDENSGDKKIPNCDPVNRYMGHTPSEWLLDPVNPWTSFFSTCTFLFGDTLRGDRFKNQWLEDKTTVKGWRKISMEHLSSLHQEAVGYQDCCATILQYCPRKMDFESDWQTSVGDKKWDVRDQLWKMDTSMKTFRRWLISVHSSLPALNLPSVKVGL